MGGKKRKRTAAEVKADDDAKKAKKALAKAEVRAATRCAAR